MILRILTCFALASLATAAAAQPPCTDYRFESQGGATLYLEPPNDSVRTMAVHGNVLYLGGDGLQILDITEALQPEIVNEVIPKSVIVYPHAVVDGVLYVTRWGTGLISYDVTDPFALVPLDTIPGLGLQGTDVGGGRLFGHLGTNVFGVDLTAPAGLTVPDTISIGIAGALTAVVDGALYVASGTVDATVAVYDVSVAGAAVFETSWTISGYRPKAIAADGDLLLVGTEDSDYRWEGLVEVHDITQRLAPQFLHSHAIVGNSLRIASDTVYVGELSHLSVFDYSDLNSPVHELRILGFPEYPSAILESNGALYIASPPTLATMDILNQHVSPLATHLVAGVVSRGSAQGDSYFVRHGDTLEAYDISGGTWDHLWSHRDDDMMFAAMAGDIMYMVNGPPTSRRLQVLDMSVPSAPSVLGEIASSAELELKYTMEMAVAHPYVLFMDEDETLRIIDATDPSAISVVGQLVLSLSYCDGYDIEHDWPYIYVKAMTCASPKGETVVVVDATDPSAPVAVDERIVKSSPEYDVSSMGALAGDTYVVGTKNRLVFYSVQDRSRLQGIGYISNLPLGSAAPVALHDDAVYFGGSDGIHLWDWSDRQNAGPLGHLRPGNYRSPFIDVTPHGLVYAVNRNDEATLYLYPLHCPNGTSGSDLPTVPGAHAISCDPNPFNPLTNVSFALSSADRVILDIYDARGRKMDTLWDGRLTEGEHVIPWDGTIDGRSAASGLYFFRLQTRDGNRTVKGTLVK